MKVALSPLVTDLPIVVVTTVVLARLANSQAILGVISLAGAAFVFYLAYGSLRTTRLALSDAQAASRSLRKGVTVNVLSPHPYLFWLTVGVPTMLKGWAKSPLAAGAFVAGFYAGLVGSKMVVAFLVGRSRGWLVGRPYVYLMRLLGLLLLAFSLLLLWDGLKLLGWMIP